MVFKISPTRVDAGNNEVSNLEIRDSYNTAVSETATAQYTLDVKRGNVFTLTLVAPSTIFTFLSSVPNSATTFTLTLIQNDQGMRRVIWPTSISWAGGTVPTLSMIPNATTVFRFKTTTLGTLWYGEVIASNTQQPSGLWGWGYNVYGELGLEDTADRSSPVQVGALTTWAAVAVGIEGTYALKTDGTLWAWGRNRSGRLGLEDTADRSSPVQVGALTTWAAVSAGRYHAFALKTDGTLWTWGNNYSAELGLGDKMDRSSPVQVGTGATWSAVSAGHSHNLLLRIDGRLFAWGGTNLSGQLGLGDNLGRSSPVVVGTITTWSAISAGQDHSLALRTNGTLWAWGLNGSGRLGLRDTANRSSPVQVGALTTWAAVSAGNVHSLALKTDGTLWTWGSNANGRLGLEDTMNRSSPVQVGALTTWAAVAASDGHSLALKTDGTLWAWGANTTYGQLGLGDTAHRSSPVQVGALTTWSSIAAGRHDHSFGIKKQ